MLFRFIKLFQQGDVLGGSTCKAPAKVTDLREFLSLCDLQH